MNKHTLKKLLSESFIPVMLVVAAMAVLLFYINFKAVSDANQVVTIIIKNPTTEKSDDTQQSEQQAVLSNPSDDPQLLEAQKQIEAKNWNQAEQIYLKLLQSRQESQIYNDLGVLYYLQKNYIKAYSQFDKAIQQKPVVVAAYVNLGLSLSKQKKYTEAIAAYDKAIEKVPYHYQAYLNKGVAQLKAGLFAAASDTLRHTSTLAGGSRKAKALYNLALAQRAQGKQFYPEAEKSLTAAIRVKPDYIEARFVQASLQDKSSAGRKRALEIYNKVLELKRDYPPAWFRIAMLQSNSKNTNAAEKAYQKALQFDPEYHKARYNLGILYLKKKQWNDARVLFQQQLIQQPANARLYFQLGRIAYGEKNYQQALQHYDKAVELKKGNYPKAIVNKGLVFDAQKKYQAAIVSYKKAIEIDKNYSQAWNNLGLAYYHLKDFTQAQTALKQAVSLRTDYALAWYNLGRSYSRDNNYSKAIDAYSQAITAKPHYAKARLNLAVLYAKDKQYPQAIKLYQHVLKDDSSYASAWLNLGITSYKTNDYQASRNALEKVLELKPDSIKARRFLAKVNMKQKKPDMAVYYLKQAIDRDQKNSALRLELAIAYVASGSNENAISELNKALRLQPDNVAAKQLLETL
ncbi:MAG: tetratricopeptide repeat protein [Gammaproteobacteria bacterium]